MKILDWRPRGERILVALWRQQKAANRLSWGHRRWAQLHDRAVARRVSQREALPNQPLLLSVGNLALGGTGKTPVVIRLALDLAARERRGAVLTRGYKSPLSGPLVVDPSLEFAGDEARLLAASLQHTDWTVIQAKSRRAGWDRIQQNGDMPEVVVLEDGHQTAHVPRHLDILILDHWQVDLAKDVVVPCTGPVFPWGPWRESAEGAGRAHIWLLETTAEVPQRGASGSLVFTFSRRFSLSAANPAASAAGEPKNPMLVSGIARPQKFEDGAQELLGGRALLAVRLADHSAYDDRLVRKLQGEMAAEGCDSLVTTTKDWIKLAALWPAQLPAYTVDLDISWGQNEALVNEVDKRL